jgi:flagellar FliJ protein
MAMTEIVETPSFTFRFERVRSLRERAEEHAREELARELRREAALDLDRQDAEIEARRRVLTEAAREREAIDRLKNRQKAAHEREAARREQIELDEVALGMHRRGKVAA